MIFDAFSFPEWDPYLQRAHGPRHSIKRPPPQMIKKRSFVLIERFELQKLDITDSQYKIYTELALQTQ